jgi:Holliday junction resolvasome RuvABC endonuclease subunit
MKELPILLAIDPSVRNLGWCIINLNKVEEDRYYDLEGEAWSYGIVQMKSTHQIDPSILKYRWEEACRKLTQAIDVYESEPTHFASEWPTFFNSMKGRIAATQNYTLGLASMVGYIAAHFDFNPENIALWTPQQWKGSVPKYVTVEKFKLIFGKKAEKLSRMLTDDTIDAIMIARYWLQLYEAKRFRWQQQPLTVNL